MVQFGLLRFGVRFLAVFGVHAVNFFLLPLWMSTTTSTTTTTTSSMSLNYSGIMQQHFS
jgi:hypothetical protein